MNQLESALVIALRDTIKWKSALESSASGTLTPVAPGLPFDATTYQERDRQLTYRDLIVGAAVIEVSVQVGDVFNYSTLKPSLQGPVPFTLPFVGTEAGTFSSQVRHVLNTSIPYDAARYADADLYGRDSLVYEVLARACAATFVDPSIPQLDSTGTVIPSTSIWSLGQGASLQADINTGLPLNRDLFKLPDQDLADRDNQLAGYVSRLVQVLKNPFSHALRLYIQIEAFGTVQREPDVYALISDDGTRRVFQAEPALANTNQIVYNTQTSTLQWLRADIDGIHVPQIYAMTIPGIEFGQSIETLAEVPERKDPQYWRSKAGQLNPAGVQVSDTHIYLTTTNSSAAFGGFMQANTASLTVPGTITFSLDGSISANDYRVSVLAKPNSLVEIAGAQNISTTDGTLGGATFEIGVASGNIATKAYLVEHGDGIVYNGIHYLAGETFAGSSIVPAYTQFGVIPSTVRQYSIDFVMALPMGPWNMLLDYTNLTGTTESFQIRADYIAQGADPVTVIQDTAPILFTTTNGNILITPDAGVDVRNTSPFLLRLAWTGGAGQLHIRKITFESEVTSGRYAMTGTFAGSTAQVDVIGEARTPGVLRWQYVSSGTVNGTVPFTINYTADATLPIDLQQVQVQTLTQYDTTPLSEDFQSWRQECLNRVERVVIQNYNLTVQAYGTDVPTFRSSGSVWTSDTTEDWMSFAEVYTPRLREVPSVAPDGIIAGYQYEVDTASVTYAGTVYTVGKKFYGVESSGSVYTNGTVHQIGAFMKSKAGHVGRPALMPRGLYFDGTDQTVKAYYDTPLSTPMIVTCQPWMIEMGLYVAQEEFWTPETL